MQQFGRGVLWTLFILPLLRMSKGSFWQVSLIAGLLLALLLNPLPTAFARRGFIGLSKKDELSHTAAQVLRR